MQINATLVKGKARVQFGANKVAISHISPHTDIEVWSLLFSYTARTNFHNNKWLKCTLSGGGGESHTKILFKL